MSETPLPELEGILRRYGAGPKTGRRMGHMPMTGPGSTLEAFAAIPVARRVFIHINNTNPALARIDLCGRV